MLDEREMGMCVCVVWGGRGGHPLQYPQELVTYIAPHPPNLCLRWLVAIKYSLKGVQSQSSFGQFSWPGNGIEGACFRLVRGVN